MTTDAGAPAETERPAKGRRRGRRTQPRPSTERVARGVESLLTLVVIGSVLAIGTVHVTTLLVVAALALSGVALALAGRTWVPIPAATLALALAAYTMLQAVPLPLGVLQHLSPTASDTWERALLPLGERVRWGSLSIDPGASLVEALKWLTYAAVFKMAASTGKRHGAAFAARLCFGSAVFVAIVTMAHGLSEARQVYGFYSPTFIPTRWSTSPLLNPNNLAGYLNLGTFAGLGLLLSSRRTLPRWLLALGTALTIAQTVLSGSRGGVLTLLLGLVATALVVPKIRLRPHSHRPRPAGHSAWNWSAVVAVGAGLGLAVLGAQNVTWQELQQEGTEKLSVATWALPMVRDHLWFGVGGGAFETAFPPYRVTGGALWRHPENFVVAWVSEWGVPIGLLALLGFAWVLRPRRLGAHQSRLVGSMVIGMAALCLQNLVDLGFSLPGVFIGLAAVAGGAWGAFQRENLDSEPERLPSSRLQKSVPWAVLSGGLTCTALVIATGGLREPRTDRALLAALYQRTDFARPASKDAFYTELRSAILRHPGDPFLPRLGALAALQAQAENPLSWASRALERDMMSGRMHLLLAEILAGRGHPHQALLELRLAAEREPGLAPTLALRAWAWARSLDDVERAVPANEYAGPSMLLALAQAVPLGENQAAFRRQLLQQALARNSSDSNARAALASDLLLELSEGREPCVSAPRPCLSQVDEHLAELPPDHPNSVELRGLRLAAGGEHEAAITWLLEQCPRTSATCLRRAVELSAQVDAAPLDEPSQAYLAVACRTAAACTTARMWIGDLYARRQLWGPAVAHYGQAARSSHSPTAWLRVANAASQQGAHQRALEAIRRAQHLAQGNPELVRRIELEQRRVVARMAGAPATLRATDEDDRSDH